MTREELNKGVNRVDIWNKSVKTFKKEVKDYNAKIKANKKAIDDLKKDIKNEKDPKILNGLKRSLKVLEQEKEQLKFELQLKKDQVKQVETMVDAAINKIVEREPELKKYVLYAQGQVFDKNITEYNKEINTISNVGEALKPREGADDKENKLRDDLKKSVEKYNEFKKKIDEAENVCKNLKIDPKTSSEYKKFITEKDNASLEIKTKFEELKNILPINSFMNYDEFRNVIDKIPVGMTIEDGLNSQIKTAQKNIENNKTALKGVLMEGRDMQVNLTGFSNVKYTKVENSLAVQTPQRSFWYRLRHPIKYRQEVNAAIAAKEAEKQQNEKAAKFENYDSSKFNLDDLKNVKFIQNKIQQDMKTRMQEAEKESKENEEENER